MKRFIPTVAACAVLLTLPFTVSACSGGNDVSKSAESSAQSAATQQQDGASIPMNPAVKEVVDDINSGNYATLNAEAVEWTAGDWHDWPTVTERPELVISKTDAFSGSANFVVDKGSMKVRRTNVCEDITACDGATDLQRIDRKLYSLEELDTMSMNDFME